MTQEQRPVNDDIGREPAMELLDGDATSAAPASPSLFMKLARGTMYGVVLLGATALLAVSAVPELAQYATFLPESNSSACHASSGSCTTLDTVSFDGGSCCADKAAMASADESGSSCPFSDLESEVSSVLAASEPAGSCCSTLSRASLLAASVGDSSDSKSCCESADVVASTETPIDAGSLLAVSTTDEPADEQSEEDRTELEPNQNNVEE